jgi:hypothetical protein
MLVSNAEALLCAEHPRTSVAGADVNEGAREGAAAE